MRETENWSFRTSINRLTLISAISQFVHSFPSSTSPSHRLLAQSRSFITWFVYTETQTRDARLEAGSGDARGARSALRLCQDSCPGIFDQDLSLARSAGHLRKALGALVALHRHDWTGLQEPGRWGPFINTPLCRGCVYHSNTRSPVAQLEGRVVTPEDSWRVDYSITREIDSHGNSIGVDWPRLRLWRFPVADPESRDGFTQ